MVDLTLVVYIISVSNTFRTCYFNWSIDFIITEARIMKPVVTYILLFFWTLWWWELYHIIMTDSDVRLYFCYYSSSPLCTNSRFDVLFYWWGYESRRDHGCSPIENCKGLCVSLVSISSVRSCYRILIMYHKFFRDV